MTTLAEIESAADALPREQKEELLLYLAVQLRTQRGEMPPPRKFTREQINAWIAEDEAEMRRFREAK